MGDDSASVLAGKTVCSAEDLLLTDVLLMEMTSP